MVVLRSCQPSGGAVPLHTEAAGTAPPDAFGRFRVLHQVGAGTLGPVFRAYDSERSRLVAVKLFQLDVPPGVDARRWQERIQNGLAARGVAADAVEVT